MIIVKVFSKRICRFLRDFYSNLQGLVDDLCWLLTCAVIMSYVSLVVLYDKNQKEMEKYIVGGFDCYKFAL